MSNLYDLLLLNGKVMTGENINPDQLDLGIVDDKIVSIGNLKSKKGREEINCQGLVILPGIIDTQVHFREPGYTHKETIEAGSKSAVLGGITGFCEMPNTKPLTVSSYELEKKLSIAKNSSWCDYAFFIGATSKNYEQLSMLESSPGCAGVKIFMGSSTGDLLVDDDKILRKILQNGSRRIAIHAEDEKRLKTRYEIYSKHKNVKIHPMIRDELSSLIATKRIVSISQEVNRKIHILHVSTSREMKYLSKFKNLVTLEVTPQHLTLASPDCYSELGSLSQMNPPIRSIYHKRALWKAIDSGLVDVIGSDHAPHTLMEKKVSYPETPSGMPGVQTMVPIMLDHFSRKKITLSKIVDLLSTGPARIYKMIGRGKIKKGYKASLTIVDINLEKSLEKKEIKSLCGWSPFENKNLKGWPVITIINGSIAMKYGELVSRPKVQEIKYF